MNAFVLLIIILGSPNKEYPIAVYTSMYNCIQGSLQVQQENVILQPYEVWCGPYILKDGYANTH